MNRSDKVILDVDLVNQMRLTHTDTEIIKFFKTSTKNFTNQCKKRSECGISWSRKWITYPKYKKTETPQSRKRVKIDKKLNTERWNNTEPAPYWNTDNTVEIWTNPIPILFTKIK
jgi:hypothetical protein